MPLSAMLLPVLLFTASAPLNPLTGAPPPLLPSPPDKQIFILSGQSNMVGLGGVVNHTWDCVVPEECRADPSILRLTANLTWAEAREPLHADIDARHACGIGPGMPFAEAVRRRAGARWVVGLVPCAMGGTRIGEWERGGRFYGEMVGRAEAAVREGGTIRAVLWYQGESDTREWADAAAYRARFREFVHQLRSDLRSPGLPVIQVALASGTGPYIGAVRRAQLGAHIANVSCVDAKRLPLEPDGLHLSTAAQVRLGQMMARDFLRYFAGPSLPLAGLAPRQCPPFVSLGLWTGIFFTLSFHGIV